MNTSSLCLRVGRAYLSGQSPNYAAARRAFRAAIRIAPEWGEPHYLLGLTFERQGKVHEAMGAYEHAIARNAGPRSLTALGWMRRLLGDFSAAIECFQSALASNCRFAEAESRLMLAECYECAGRTGEAVGEWNKVASMSPAYPSYEQPAEAARANLARYECIGLRPDYKAKKPRAPSALPSLARRRSRTLARNWQVRSGT